MEALSGRSGLVQAHVVRFAAMPTDRPVNVLVVEDDQAVIDMLRRHLTRAGMTVQTATTEQDALRRASTTLPDVIVLDLGLAGGSGAGFCERVRALPSIGDVPILVLSARDDLATKVGMLGIGSDDYVVKPCDPAELIARIGALLRRRDVPRTARRIGPLRIALETGDAWVGGTQLELTAAERGILIGLARSHPGTAPRAALQQRWGERDAASNVMEVLITRLRRKLAAAGGGVEIASVRRTGYQLRVSDQQVVEVFR